MARARNTIEGIESRLVALDNGCLVWPGTKCNGYGLVGFGRKIHRVHRLLWVSRRGEIPDGMGLDHLCHTRECTEKPCPHRACANLDHLQIATPLVNAHRGRGGIHNLVKTHCPLGHAYDDTNTRMWRGKRLCRECRRASSRIHKQKKKG